ncbi:MAG: LysR family transcriptional regulator [Hydrogenophaga sp.]|uniref:LysR family transcriptional regulator n=1 Tax=Hydrogenophaga sp. TaxID=1904254 RepID=UPI001D1C7C8C|nr:LysR family transcriptional regulator [Hydrogenophaga sp.]MBX3610291.1 LysR family transcriptional regulator [Hydrogenophaga sp.]
MTETRNPQRGEWRQWRQFAALAEELHFGRAAARLHMTQPALTQAIAALEVAVGTRLFERNRRHVALSTAGAALLPEVRELLRRTQALPALARSAAQGESGSLRVAFVSTVGYGLLPPWVRRFRERWPRVALELVEATSDVQREALARGHIDAGFLLHAPGADLPGLQRQALASEPMWLALPESHPLAARARPSLTAVAAEPMVMFPRRILPEVFDALVQLHRSTGVEPVVAQEAIQMQTIVNLVSAGLGLAWVLQSVRQFQRPGVVYRPVALPRGLSAPVCETSLVWRAEADHPVLQRFVEAGRAQ